MSAQNYSMMLPYVKQGNIRVRRSAVVEMEVLLYNNPIIKYRHETDLEGQRSRSLVLDPCGKPTQTTARAMTRGLNQLEWAGRVVFEAGQLWFVNEEFGVDKQLINAPFTVPDPRTFGYYESIFLKPGAVVVTEVTE